MELSGYLLISFGETIDYLLICQVTVFLFKFNSDDNDWVATEEVLSEIEEM